MKGNEMKVNDVKILPPSIADVAELIGLDNALKILIHIASNKRRGGYVFVPKRYGIGSKKFEGVIDKASIDKLMAVYGGSRIFFNSKRYVLSKFKISGILGLRKSGFSVSDIAWFYGVSERYVSKVTCGYGRKDG